MLAALRVLDLNNFDSMIRLSIAIGAAHLVLANLLVVCRRWGSSRALPPLGWAILTLGGLWLWLGERSGGGLPAPGYWLLGAGALLILAFTDQRPCRRPADWLQRALRGLLALTNLPRIFGDVLSYLRLFALGLASASLALTFNQLAIDVLHKRPGIGLFFCILILGLGHTLNLALAIVSGVVHGLRLNFIEFFNWSLSDEGYPFRRFAKKELESWES
jgi:V/A-type H+-transporting ATPase subunit I